MTAVERVAAALAAIAARPELGAFWAVDHEGARLAAQAVDARHPDGAAGQPLGGMPVAIKDCFDVAGLPTTGGALGTASPAGRDAEVVGRLRAAGAVPVGKTAMDQLGWGTSGIAPGRPPCVNPHDRSRSPGGSSAGSAAAVAASLVPLAIGTDTMGSVRTPAAYCGIVGLKPALRALPRDGCDMTAPSMETVGILARDVAGARTAYELLCGRRVAPAAGRPLRVGRLDDLFEVADPQVAAAAARALEAVTAHHPVREARLAWRPRGLGVLVAAELDGTWGARIRAEPERFTDEIREGAQRGAAVSASERLALLDDLRAARRKVRRRLQHFDVVASPTVPHLVPRSGADSVEASTRFTRPFNALGWPAITIPCGTDGDGLPLALQLAAPPAGLPELLEVAAAVERHMAG